MSHSIHVYVLSDKNVIATSDRVEALVNQAEKHILLTAVDNAIVVDVFKDEVSNSKDTQHWIGH